MASLLRTILDKLFHDLGLQMPVFKLRRYHLDEEMAGHLRLIADQEQRDEDQVASELLTLAIRQRVSADKHLQKWRSLTRREQQAVALACLGYLNTDIAQRMGISETTVKTHIFNAAQKFGLQSKAQLVQALSEWDFSAWDR
jgi:two-component system response regulator NreC